MTPEETYAAVVGMLQASGLPMTTDNLNRAMLAVARGEMLQPEPVNASAGVERSMQRVMQPRQVTQRPLPIPPIPPEQVPQAAAPVVEQTPQAAMGDNPGVMYDAAPESFVSQRRGTLQRPRYEGDTGPAADWQPRSIDPSDIGAILMLSPWLGAGYGMLPRYGLSFNRPAVTGPQAQRRITGPEARRMITGPKQQKALPAPPKRLTGPN